MAQVTTEERGQVLLARRVVRRRGGFRGGGFRGGSVRVYRSGPYRGRSFYVYPRGRYYRRGYAVYPRWRYVAPWPIYAGPVYPYDPYYHTYVHVWDGPQYSTPSMDVRRLALPEGVIKAGGEVSGFVYFQNAMSRSERLELIWHARSASTGQELATLRIPFVITRM